MSKKHNTKHARSTNVRYAQKVQEGEAGGRMADPILTDGKRASAKR